jgi:hypothetical protein
MSTEQKPKTIAEAILLGLQESGLPDMHAGRIEKHVVDLLSTKMAEVLMGTQQLIGAKMFEVVMRDLWTGIIGKEEAGK